MKDQKIAYIQWLRVFAAFAVVLMHTAAQQWNLAPVQSGPWRVLTMWESLVRWPVPVFVMITGAIFLPRKTELGTVLRRYIPRIAAAWLVWSWIYANYLGSTGEEVLDRFFSGHYHLWYLPFLCGVYLTLPFLQKIAEDDRLTKQLLAVGCVVALAVPWLADAAEIAWPEAAQRLRTVENHLHYTFFFDLLSLLVLGHVLHRADLSPKARGWIYAAGLVSVAVTGIATILVSEHIGGRSTLFFDQASPNSLCAAAALFVFARYHLRSLPKLVDWMARHSFGVYLCHALLIEILARQEVHVLTWDPVWSVPVLSAGIFAVSLAISALIAKIPFIGKFLT